MNASASTIPHDSSLFLSTGVREQRETGVYICLRSGSLAIYGCHIFNTRDDYYRRDHYQISAEYFPVTQR